MTGELHNRAARTLARALGTIVIGTAILFGTMSATATAQPGELVTDYSTYPEALPAGCMGGTSVVSGLIFSNGRGDTATNLRNLDLAAGDTLTMQWDDFAAGCAAADGTPLIAVGLASYHNESLHFDHTVNETVIDWATCGAGTAPCVRSNGRYTLSLTVPANGVGPDCFLQIDALIGRPLAIVGPAGSYYNNSLRGGSGADLLISARNFAVQCAAPVEAAKPGPATVTPQTPPSVVTPTTVESARVEVAQPIPAKVLSIQVTADEPARLPATGTSGSGPLTALAITLGAAGFGLVRFSRRFA